MLIGNNEPWFTSKNLGSGSGDIYITQLNAIHNDELHEIHVRRAGIGPGGYGILESPVLRVWARLRPPLPASGSPTRPTASGPPHD